MRQTNSRLKIVFAGHVDHGKSTLIGRILSDTHSLPDGKIEQIEKACREEGVAFEHAFLLDALLEEQAQNITIDTTQIQFKSPQRDYVIIDAPGHKEFLKNMISGAASADAAVLLVAADEGVQEQSRRHGYLLGLLGIKQVMVAVNKMDTVGYSKTVFDQLCEETADFLRQIGIEPRCFVPISARHGDNIVMRNCLELSWYDGPTILEALDAMDLHSGAGEQVLRFPIQDVYRFDERRILAGRVEAGVIKVGDTLCFSPNHKRGLVKSIERWSAPCRDFAEAGESIGITLTEQIFVDRGHIASHETAAPIECNYFKARLFWMGRHPLHAGCLFKLKLATQEVNAAISRVEKIIDASTLEPVMGRLSIEQNDVADVVIQTRSPLVVDTHGQHNSLSRFVIMDGHQVAGGGIVIEAHDAHDSTLKSNNIYWSEGTVTAPQRAFLNGHQGGIVWLTGLSGSGKSTIAKELERELFQQSIHAYVLDGDNMRHGLNANLGFSPEDRVENIRRVAEVARLMADAGLIVIAAFISPYLSDRQRAREIAQEGGFDFMEVFVNAPLTVCEQRDPKQLYKKARSGAIKQFTGIDAPYEPPQTPEVIVNTDQQTIAESVTYILDFLRSRLHVDGSYQERVR